MEILVFATGMIFFYTKSYLALLVVCVFCLFRPHWKWFGAFVAAYAIGMSHQWWVSDKNMPLLEVIPRVNISGVIMSIPIQTEDKTTFEFQADHLNDTTIQAHLLLSCYQHCPTLHAGEAWSLRAKLHQAHNLNNPGGFDYKTLLSARHIVWTGYASGVSFQKQIKSHSQYLLLVARERLALYLTSLIKEDTILGITQALTLGVTSHISQELWGLFRRTGTTHLMVISGAHIGLVAGMIFQLARRLWVLSSRLCLRHPAPKVASILAIIAGFSYAVIAGFGVPAERSAVASFFIFVRQIGRKQFGAWQAWRYALLIVLVTEPHAVLMPGFYLSFGAVAILLTMNQRIKADGWRKGLLLQLSCMLGLMPFTIFWFSYGAVDGLIANVVAIPLVSFLVVPLSLLTLLLGLKLTWLVVPLKVAIMLLLHYLHWVDSLAPINLKMTYLSIILPVMGMVGMVLCISLPLKAIIPSAVAMLLTALYPARVHLKLGEFQVSVMDVGQGSANIIQTRYHTILYDTGGQMYHGTDMGHLVLMPYLRTIGATHLDRIIVSHPDLDHRGGLTSLEAGYPGSELIVDNPDFYHRGRSCHDYPAWDWDGIHFAFFPLDSLKTSKNNGSCVLQVSNHAGKILFTGDIEREAEHYLVQKYGQAIQSTVLMVPHHGSKTSSTPRFVQQVSPLYAVISHGFDNRYHFPHQQTLNTYHQQHIPIYTTAKQGMITLHFYREHLQLSSYVK